VWAWETYYNPYDEWKYDVEYPNFLFPVRKHGARFGGTYYCLGTQMDSGDRDYGLLDVHISCGYIITMLNEPTRYYIVSSLVHSILYEMFVWQHSKHAFLLLGIESWRDSKGLVAREVVLSFRLTQLHIRRHARTNRFNESVQHQSARKRAGPRRPSWLV